MANVAQLAAYIQNDLNVLISGLPGTGKTTIIRQACEQLGLTVKYYNAATLDPFTDLIGLPVPNQETRTTDYFRPRIIDEAEVIIMDEINRADPRTLNTIFELVQFHSINGEHLPKLRVVVAAMNPPNGDFNVDELDPALVDRFDIYLEQTPDFDYRYFANKFGDDVARAGHDWWRAQYQAFKSAKQNTNNNAVYVSPRRMEIVINAYSKIRQLSTIKASLPLGATGAADLHKRLEAAFSSATTPQAVQAQGDFGYLLTLNEAQIRSRKHTDRIQKTFENNPKDAEGRSQFLSSMALAFSDSIGAAQIVARFGFAVEEFTPAQETSMMRGWQQAKQREYYTALQAYKAK